MELEHRALAYFDFLSCGYILTSDDTNACLSLKMDFAMPPSSDPCVRACGFQRHCGQVAGPRVVVRERACQRVSVLRTIIECLCAQIAHAMEQAQCKQQTHMAQTDTDKQADRATETERERERETEREREDLVLVLEHEGVVPPRLDEGLGSVVTLQ